MHALRKFASDRRSASKMVLYKIKHVENKGRCLAADAYIRAGDAVLACEPYEATLEDAEVSKRSHLTFEILQRPLRCGQCKFARFCSCNPNLSKSLLCQWSLTKLHYHSTI